MAKRVTTKKGSKSIRSQGFAALVLGAPALVLITVFMLLPFVMSIGYSFTDKMLVSGKNNTVNFVGLSNYIKLFTSEAFRQA